MQIKKLEKQLKAIKERSTDLQRHISDTHSQVRRTCYILNLAVSNPQSDVRGQFVPLEIPSIDDKRLKGNCFFS